jgi:hypothetical protein
MSDSECKLLSSITTALGPQLIIPCPTYGLVWSLFQWPAPGQVEIPSKSDQGAGRKFAMKLEPSSDGSISINSSEIRSCALIILWRYSQGRRELFPGSPAGFELKKPRFTIQETFVRCTSKWWSCLPFDRSIMYICNKPTVSLFITGFPTNWLGDWKSLLECDKCDRQYIGE